MLQDNLRSAFHVKHRSVEHLRVRNRRHELVFRRKRHLIQQSLPFPIIQIINSLIIKPKQQRALGWVSDYLHLVFICKIKKCGGIDRQTLFQNVAHLFVVKFLIWQGVTRNIIDRHLVLRQCAGLVSADDSSCAHSLTGMHFSHQVVGNQHSMHAQRKA